jgi:two-component system, OmpR family, sensor histidine kinase AdeS
MTTTLGTRIALSAIVISVVAALVAAFVPDYIYLIRDKLFLASLSAPDQQTLSRLLADHGQCSPQVQSFKLAHGFAPWRLNYNWALGALIVLTAAVCGAVAIGSAQRIARPIAALADSARAVARGGREPPPPLGSGVPREIATLHRDFTTMVTALDAADNDVRLRSAAIAHELRTPLAVMRGRLVGAQAGVFAFDEAMLESLLRQITLVDQLVADLNLLAARQQGELRLERAEVRLDQIALAVIEALRPEAEAGGATLIAEVAAITTRADPARIERALLNLVSNAIRYAPGSTIRLSVGSSGDRIVLAVSDTGPGWPVADPQALAGAFVRGDESRSRQSGGSGLGLAIVEAAARAHGGELRLSANQPRGARAEMILPAD